MKKMLLIPVLLSLLLFSLSCSPNVNTNSDDLIKIGDTTGDWGFPSPYGMYSRGPGYIRMSLIFDTLVWKDEQGNIIPMLAESWSYDKEKISFTFNLRKDVLWHDGEQFTASDAAFTFNYIKEYPWVWVNSDVIKSTEVIDDYTVQINLTDKYAPFLNNIAGTLPILPRHIWEDIQDPLSYNKNDALTGTGPYILKDYNSQEGSYLYEANNNYYLGDVNTGGIAFVRSSEQSMPAMIKSGEIDAGQIPPDVASELEESEFEIKKEPPIWAAKLILNHNNNGLIEKKSFRQALAYAINYDQIVEISQRGFAVKGSAGLLPPANGIWYNKNTPQYEYNVEKARGILEDIGFSIGKDGYYYKDGNILELELAVSEGDFERDAQIVKKNLEDTGIKIDLVSYESKTLDSKIENWDFDIAISGHGGLGGDPESLNRVIIGEGFNSVRYFKNDRLLELLNIQVGEMNMGTRIQMIYEIQEIYAEELPSITLYYPQWYWAHNEKADIFFTEGGIAIGIPIPLNKITFINM
ncbi:MAG: ABC transporter substrate-binding protein [Actinomycetota bacterium]|nr:ABC transporter substrate-binding protein [Actinomycetota bacterium]